MGVLVDRFEEHEGEYLVEHPDVSLTLCRYCTRRCDSSKSSTTGHRRRYLQNQSLGLDYLPSGGTFLTDVLQTFGLRIDAASLPCTVTWIMFELFSSIAKCLGSYVFLLVDYCWGFDPFADQTTKQFAYGTARLTIALPSSRVTLTTSCRANSIPRRTLWSPRGPNHPCMRYLWPAQNLSQFRSRRYWSQQSRQLRDLRLFLYGEIRFGGP